MTEQEQNEAIAKAIGQRYHKSTEEEIKRGSYYQYEPQFTRDLNAMREVLRDKICGDSELKTKFLQELNLLIESVADSEGGPVICVWDMALVVAEGWMLARAFLRTIGKWRDEGGAMVVWAAAVEANAPKRRRKAAL